MECLRPPNLMRTLDWMLHAGAGKQKNIRERWGPASRPRAGV